MKLEKEGDEKKHNAVFTRAEELLFVQLAMNDKAIVECQLTDTLTSKSKADCWNKIAHLFNAENVNTVISIFVCLCSVHLAVMFVFGLCLPYRFAMRCH